ncbi:MAG: 2-C-methyl-D-erythritol 4-phosphate cytidylyltransferase [Clostridia bacterium]|nr:2-C-methyl-D-erythritol 4-phosphate cytidylyltransferase [Clostridia bacterium]
MSLNVGRVPHVCAMILAAGSGSRMKADITKQKMLVGNMSVLRRTVSAFDKCRDVHSLVVAVREDEVDFARRELAGIKKPMNIVIGGKNRAESAAVAFGAVGADATHVAIHDGARCLISPEMISMVVAEAAKCGAASAVSMIYDTVKRIDEAGNIVATVDRSRLVRATTPQVFDIGIYKRAIESYPADEAITDDNMLVERLGIPVKAVDVGASNIKITTMQDIKYAEFLLGEGEKNV